MRRRAGQPASPPGVSERCPGRREVLGVESGDVPRARQPQALALGREVAERPAQLPEPGRATHEERVQGDGRHQRAPGGELEIRVQLLDELIGERRRGAHAMLHHGRVVGVDGIGHAEQRAVAGLEPGRLIVVEPVEGVLVARLLEQLRRDGGLRQIGAEPAPRPAPLVAGEGRSRLANHGLLLGLRHGRLALAVGAAVGHDLVAAGAERLDHARAQVVHRGVEIDGERDVERVDDLEHVPQPHPGAVIAPGEGAHVRLRLARRQLRALALTERPRLDIDRDVDREAVAAGPLEVRPIDDRAERIPGVLREHKAGPCSREKPILAHRHGPA
jgi:hypothetical protein